MSKWKADNDDEFIRVLSEDEELEASDNEKPDDSIDEEDVDDEAPEGSDDDNDLEPVFMDEELHVPDEQEMLQRAASTIPDTDEIQLRDWGKAVRAARSLGWQDSGPATFCEVAQQPNAEGLRRSGRKKTKRV